jgi:hypothetical protein
MPNAKCGFTAEAQRLRGQKEEAVVVDTFAFSSFNLCVSAPLR